MANRIVSVHAGIYGMGIYAIMLPSSGFSVAHYMYTNDAMGPPITSKCRWLYPTMKKHSNLTPREHTFWPL